MFFKVQIDVNCEETVTATVHRRTPLIDEIERLILQENMTDQLFGYDGDEICVLEIQLIECFFSEADKTYAIYADGRKYQVKKRLYELETILPKEFERISKSALANWKRVSKLSVQLSGAVNVVFKSGYVDCISRRCFSELKRRYGL